MSERLGPSLVWWCEQPAAFVLWAFYHLQELDRRRQWEERAGRIEAAQLNAVAFHDPAKLGDERQRHILDAAPPGDHERALQEGWRLLQDLEESHVLPS